jgi:integrase
VSALFRDAALEGLIDASPCILTDAQLGPLVDADPAWRAGSVFTREEAETLIADPRIPADRQLVYAFGVLAGIRPGEAAALRFRHWDPSVQPLGKLFVTASYHTRKNVSRERRRTSCATCRCIRRWPRCWPNGACPGGPR